MPLLRHVPPPNLPLSGAQYSELYHEQFNNILRLYFNQLSNNFQSLFGSYGARFLSSPFGSFYDTTDQTAASTTTAYPITFNTTDISNGVSVQSSSKIRVTYPGYYNIQYSIQLSNNDNTTQDVDIWFSKNGENIADSNSRFGLAPRKSAGDPYHVIAALNYITYITENDYIEIYWRSSNTNTYIEYYAAPSSPTRPAIPSVIMTVTFVSGVE